MNIKQAKEQVRNTVKIYLQRNEYGEYAVPFNQQRPIFLIGAPGIGKTAIMEQVAHELDIGIISYSMSHHTRQSALGLPLITHESYDGKTFDISEYTMSEIIASIYRVMKNSEKKEGILFLDEVNCVSETLAPTMLQFLQMKRFGTHFMPEGWVIVTAGNPPQYNKSVREFDIATMDRLKIIDVEPEYKVWREYATTRGIHGAILSYLDIRKHDFYLIETSLKGKSYVTPRGWEDLSAMIYMYEENKFIVEEEFIIQYLRNEEVARDFSVFYELYNKYKSDYEVDTILKGEASEQVYERARFANFDERLSLLGILLNVIHSNIRLFIEKEKVILRLREIMINVKEEAKDKSVVDILRTFSSTLAKELKLKLTANSISNDQRLAEKLLINSVNSLLKLASLNGADGFEEVRKKFNSMVKELEHDKLNIDTELENLFNFVDDNWGLAKEMVIVVNDITMNTKTSQYVSKNGCDKYFMYNKALLFNDRKESLLNKIKDADYFIPIS